MAILYLILATIGTAGIVWFFSLIGLWISLSLIVSTIGVFLVINMMDGKKYNDWEPVAVLVVCLVIDILLLRNIF